ncbi:MAG: dihydroorotate dehydrogenase electron transfer subunit [Ignavibacteria bacterium]|nr:dihydroorotate dehydrogenase electron transfer subunit [Ignavibacteria bacterium]
MFITKAPVEKVIELKNHIFILKIFAPEIASIIKPGEFLNVKVCDSNFPLLRRPFSVCDVEGDFIFLMFNIFGEGTKILANKHKGDLIDLLGPLGKGFNIEGDYDTAILVAGGLGVAPFPYFIRKIGNSKKIHSFIGGKTDKDIITYRMKNITISTDDGSLGIKGNVVELLEQNIEKLKSERIKIFACGPNAMLRKLRELCIRHNLNCEASIECAMACGFGICQGCPIESVNYPDKYLLVCKNGPVFNIRDVVI